MRETLSIVMRMGHLRRLFPLWLVGLAVLVLWFSTWLLLALVYGVVMQFFVEYVMHRFLYHRDPPAEQSAFNALYRTHIGHHEFPNDPEFFTGDDHWFAVRFGLISVLLHLAVLWPFTGLAFAAQFAVVALFVGSVSAYAFYEFCHTLAHVKVPKGWFGQRVTQSHMKHHFNDHETTFHVSFGMGWIDRLMGTTYDREDAKTRYDGERILSMGMDPEDLRLVTARKAFGITQTPRSKSA
ncbi:Fatty acid hydroxylase FAH1P [Candidatus Rhodobacter oscarellae]|uniref:Fatty acid hydroxylase FAH1P n=1 Tax=Candidatus Rhodobacter oscarellae TaxID=1675527 RepID=A0A0J9E9K0_9RHOB|nr:sterol desaturase family protein [Candidatus Rhodobacter lobularis]KMW59472.1 Fatty acid hydroxylase FAH1P [Candidatus Rhodobacter lobularis]